MNSQTLNFQRRYDSNKTEEKMIQREIAVAVSNANQGVHVFDTIDAIQKAGFKYVFIQ